MEKILQPTLDQLLPRLTVIERAESCSIRVSTFGLEVVVNGVTILRVEDTPIEKPAYSDVVFSTTQAAELLMCSVQMISNACDKGRLAHFKVPGSKFRRIIKSELIKFMVAENYPESMIQKVRDANPRR